MENLILVCIWGSTSETKWAVNLFFKGHEVGMEMGWKSLEGLEESSRNGYAQIYCIHIGNFQ